MHYNHFMGLEECKKKLISQGDLANFFSNLTSKNLFPAISELVYVPRDVLCLITSPKFLQESMSNRNRIAVHPAVPHLKVVVNIPLVFGLRMGRMDTSSSIPKSSFIFKKMNRLNIKEIQWLCQANAICLVNLK